MENKNKMAFFFQDSKLEQVTSSSFIIEVACSLPFIVTVSIYTCSDGPSQYNSNIVESGVKHQNPNPVVMVDTMWQ